MECPPSRARLGAERNKLSQRKAGRFSSFRKYGYACSTTGQPETSPAHENHISTVANLSSIYGAYLWPANDAPGYVMGLATTSAFCFACAISAIAAKYLTAKYPYTFDYEKWGAEAESDEVVINEKAST